MFVNIIKESSILSNFVIDRKLKEYHDLYAEIKESQKIENKQKAISKLLKNRNLKEIPKQNLMKRIIEIQGDNNVCMLCGSVDRFHNIQKRMDFIEEIRKG